MDERKGFLLEFLMVAALTVVMLTALVVMAVAGVTDSTVDVVRSAFTAALGAVLALAYAARAVKPPNGKP